MLSMSAFLQTGENEKKKPASTNKEEFEKKVQEIKWLQEKTQWLTVYTKDKSWRSEKFNKYEKNTDKRKISEFVQGFLAPIAIEILLSKDYIAINEKISRHGIKERIKKFTENNSIINMIKDLLILEKYDETILILYDFLEAAANALNKVKSTGDIADDWFTLTNNTIEVWEKSETKTTQEKTKTSDEVIQKQVEEKFLKHLQKVTIAFKEYSTQVKPSEYATKTTEGFLLIILTNALIKKEKINQKTLTKKLEENYLIWRIEKQINNPEIKTALENFFDAAFDAYEKLQENYQEE